MSKQPTHVYTAVVGIFLLLQGISTLTFRLFPALDQALPALLAITRMIPPHSLLHILTGLLALAVLFRGWKRGAFWFASCFALFYVGLAFVGMIIGHPTILGLQPFDHFFHFLLGGLGLVAVGLDLYRTDRRKKASL
jgi:MFS superfamily sulfate permease-like transporter